MNRLNPLVIIVAFLLPLNGCGMVVLTAVDTVRGEQSDLLIVETVQDLQSYHAIVLEPVTSAVGEQLDPTLLAYLNSKIHDELVHSGIKLSDEGQLHLSGLVLHVENGIRKKQLVVQMKLQVTKTGQSLGVANITGQSSGLRGLKSSAGGIAKEISELLKTHQYPVET
ncbi:MAG: hypothetical protein ABFS39_17855 [Pseudomonadota bacterium]